MRIEYRIVAWSDLYRGQWCVIRESDQRLIKTFPDPRIASVWVRVWGPISAAKVGNELSWRAVERL